MNLIKTLKLLSPPIITRIYPCIKDRITPNSLFDGDDTLF